MGGGAGVNTTGTGITTGGKIMTGRSIFV